MTILFLIVARGGSKRIPGKNLRQIKSISLVGYKCLAAKASKRCNAVILSTDSPQIADEARQYGVSVPFIRPEYLATDEATTEDVVRHAISITPPYDAIMLLEPSSPYVRPQDYDAAVEIMEQTGAEFVYGMPWKIGTLYLFKWDYLAKREDLYDSPRNTAGYELLPECNMDIDTIQDLHYAEFLAERGYVDLSWTKTTIASS